MSKARRWGAALAAAAGTMLAAAQASAAVFTYEATTDYGAAIDITLEVNDAILTADELDRQTVLDAGFTVTISGTTQAGTAFTLMTISGRSDGVGTSSSVGAGRIVFGSRDFTVDGGDLPSLPLLNNGALVQLVLDSDGNGDFLTATGQEFVDLLGSAETMVLQGTITFFQSDPDNPRANGGGFVRTGINFGPPVNADAVPLPAAALLFAPALLGLGALRRSARAG